MHRTCTGPGTSRLNSTQRRLRSRVLRRRRRRAPSRASTHCATRFRLSSHLSYSPRFSSLLFGAHYLSNGALLSSTSRQADSQPAGRYSFGGGAADSTFSSFHFRCALCVRSCRAASASPHPLSPRAPLDWRCCAARSALPIPSHPIASHPTLKPRRTLRSQSVRRVSCCCSCRVASRRVVLPRARVDEKRREEKRRTK